MTASYTADWEDYGDNSLSSDRSRSFVARVGVTTSNFLSRVML